ncbi:MAG: tRNA preQ1(34) S-adenosylmethionine ribosyltransferase-isomerase QueA [Vicinamibacterales bacterium]
MNVADFDFDLPDELIAQDPPAERGGSRLLVVPKDDAPFTDARFADLPALLDPGDLLVVNDTRVYPARLLGHRVPSGGAVECLLLESTGADTWLALVHPGQKLKPGAHVRFESGTTVIEGEILDHHFHGRRTVRLWRPDGGSVDEAVDAIGHIPLPPYIQRDDAASDRDRYQTVYARARGSIAAPTAGLHFTPAILSALNARGVQMVTVTLHVGYGTFKPVRVDRVEDHAVDPEPFEVTEETAAVIAEARRQGRRVIAVGTTTTRVLESLDVDGDRVRPGRGRTDLFIHPGHRFRVVQGLITNFHLPKSSLLMLVSAFASRERILAAYGEAVRRRYRFYSYGDAMLIR